VWRDTIVLRYGARWQEAQGQGHGLSGRCETARDGAEGHHIATVRRPSHPLPPAGVRLRIGTASRVYGQRPGRASAKKVARPGLC